MKKNGRTFSFEKKRDGFIVAGFSAVAVLFTIIALAVSANNAEKVCIYRTFEKQENAFNMSIIIDVNEKNPPRSFIIEENIPIGWLLAEINPAQTMYLKEEGRLIWLFWSKGYKIEDAKINYLVIPTTNMSISGIISIANNPDNPEKGLRQELITFDKICLR